MKRKSSLARVRTPHLGSALLILVAFLMLAGVALAAGTPAIDRWVIAGGGGRAVLPSRSLSGTLGQSVVGVTSSGAHGLCAGFWCRPGAPRQASYLPLLLRGF
jgi:hypothetical protein